MKNIIKNKIFRFIIEMCFSFGIFAFFSLSLKDLFVPICYLLGYTHSVLIRIFCSYLDLKFNLDKGGIKNV